MQTTYANMETAAGWHVVIGPSVNPVPPSGYTFVQTSAGIMNSIIGPKYAGALSALALPYPPNQGTAALQFEVMPDLAVPVCAQVLEFDTRISIAGWNYNFSSQLNLQEGGTMQIVNAAGAWIDSGFKPGPAPSNVWTTFKYSYTWDTVKEVFSITAMAVGTQGFTVPVTMQNVPAAKLDWADSVNFQIQIGLNANGGACTHTVRNATYVF